MGMFAPPPMPPKRGLQWWHWLLIAGGGHIARACNVVMDGGLGIFRGGDTLEVNVKGKHFDFNVNASRVASYDAASYTGGRIGLAVSGAIEVVFSDLVITRIG